MLKLKAAQRIVSAALAEASAREMKPLAVVVLDARGAPRALAAQDGASLKRAEIAIGKAHGALSLGLGSRAIQAAAIARPHFIAAVTHVAGGSLVPTAGGVLIRDRKGEVVGAVGVSGDTSDNDEIAAMAGIAAAGFTGDPGEG